MTELYINISRLFPFNCTKKLARVNPLIINYHTVSDQRLKHILHLYKYRNIKGFVEDLDFLCRKFHPIGLIEFLDYAAGKVSLPDNAFLITFDDGLREIYDIIVPILKKKNLTATFFLTHDYIDNHSLGYDHKKSLIIDHLINNNDTGLYNKISSLLDSVTKSKTKLHQEILLLPYDKGYLVDEMGKVLNYNFNTYLKENKPYVSSLQINEMLRSGFTIGAHGTDHPRFSEITFDNQLMQARSSAELIASQFSLPYKVFAFPYSDDKVTLDFFQEILSDISLTFGTNGLNLDQVKTNYQRISVENYPFSAKTMLKYYYVKKSIFKLANKDTIQRNSLKMNI